RDAAEKMASRWKDAVVARSLDELLDDASIDAVFICTSTASHREVCIATARAGKHIFCEKPLAMNAADGVAMLAAIDEAGVIAQVGLVLRFSPIYTVMRQLAHESSAGRVLAVTMRDDQDFPIRGAHP